MDMLYVWNNYSSSTSIFLFPMSETIFIILWMWLLDVIVTFQNITFLWGNSLISINVGLLELGAMLYTAIILESTLNLDHCNSPTILVSSNKTNFICLLMWYSMKDKLISHLGKSNIPLLFTNSLASSTMRVSLLGSYSYNFYTSSTTFSRESPGCNFKVSSLCLILNRKDLNS